MRWAWKLEILTFYTYFSQFWLVCCLLIGQKRIHTVISLAEKSDAVVGKTGKIILKDRQLRWWLWRPLRRHTCWLLDYSTYIWHSLAWWIRQEYEVSLFTVILLPKIHLQRMYKSCSTKNMRIKLISRGLGCMHIINECSGPNKHLEWKQSSCHEL